MTVASVSLKSVIRTIFDMLVSMGKVSWLQDESFRRPLQLVLLLSRELRSLGGEPCVAEHCARFPFRW